MKDEKKSEKIVFEVKYTAKKFYLKNVYKIDSKT